MPVERPTRRSRRRLSNGLVAGAFSSVLAQSSPSFAAESERPEEAIANSNSVVLTGAAGGLASYKGDMGPWLELFVGHDFRLSPTFVLRLEGSFLYTSYSHDSSFQQIDGTEVLDVQSADDVWGIGGQVRGLLAYELSRRWALRAGVLLGFASEQMASSHCPADTLSAPFHGLSAGAAVRLGASRRYELGLLADFVAYPLIYCAGKEPPETHERNELSYDDPTLAATGRFAVHW